MKLARLMDTGAELWLNMQCNHDLWEQRRKLAAQLETNELVAAGDAENGRFGH